MTIERVAHAARRHRRDLRKPPQRHRRCRRAVPEGRQCRDPARRLGELPLLPRDPCAASRRACASADLPEDAIQLVPTRDRAAVGVMLAGLDGSIDVIVPRGGKSLVARVQAEARVPVFAHLEGICHVYVHAAADLAMAKTIVAQRQDAAHRRLRRGRNPAGRPRRARRRIWRRWSRRCSTRAATCAATRRRRPPIARVKPATEEDWSTEYLDAIIAVKVVDGLDAAIGHIERYGSHHTDAIVTDDAAAAQRFLAEVDSAIVLHNASTQFADGGEFGFGGEIGIATGRCMRAGRSASSSCTFKYRVRGSGQTRP